MKKLFLLISIFSVGIISQAAHISGVKFNNICTQNTGSTDNEDFRNLAPITRDRHLYQSIFSNKNELKGTLVPSFSFQNQI